MCVCVWESSGAHRPVFHPHPVYPISASRLSDHVPADASQRFPANWSEAARTMTAQPAVGTQPYGPEGNPMGLNVPPHRPCPDQHTPKSPAEEKGKRNHPHGRSGRPTVGDVPKTATARLFRAAAFPRHSHSTGARGQGNRDNAKIP